MKIKTQTNIFVGRVQKNVIGVILFIVFLCGFSGAECDREASQ